MNAAQNRAYMRDYMRNRTRIRRRAVVEFLGGKCAKCGGTESLEVDHVDPKAKESHRFLTWSTKRLVAELAKCQLLCRACRWNKTRSERWGHATGPEKGQSALRSGA